MSNYQVTMYHANLVDAETKLYTVSFSEMISKDIVSKNVAENLAKHHRIKFNSRKKSFSAFSDIMAVYIDFQKY